MIKTIEDAAKKYSCDSPVTWENFCPGDIADAFKDGAEYVMPLPLDQRLTTEEKEKTREQYDEVRIFTENKNPPEYYLGQKVVLERIFGKELFERKEEE